MDLGPSVLAASVHRTGDAEFRLSPNAKGGIAVGGGFEPRTRDGIDTEERQHLGDPAQTFADLGAGRGSESGPGMTGSGVERFDRVLMSSPHSIRAGRILAADDSRPAQTHGGPG